MIDESEHGELHGVFDAEVSGLVIGASPVAAVMRDGAVRRTRRRLAVTSGVAALAVLPVASVGVFAGGHNPRGGTVRAVSSPASSGAGNPPPIVVPAPLPGPGQLNPALPNDSVVVLASGTENGRHWRLVRDRYVVAGPEPANVMGDPASRPHLPYAANWDKPGTIECDFTGIVWGDGAPGGLGPGGGCNPTDDGSIARITGRFDGGGGSVGSSADAPYLISGRIDGKDAAYVTVDVDGWSSGKLPVIEVPGEQNDYYVAVLPRSAAVYDLMTTTVYDARGRSLGSQQMKGVKHFGKPVPSPVKSAQK